MVINGGGNLPTLYGQPGWGGGMSQPYNHGPNPVQPPNGITANPFSAGLQSGTINPFAHMASAHSQLPGGVEPNTGGIPPGPGWGQRPPPGRPTPGGGNTGGPPVAPPPPQRGGPSPAGGGGSVAPQAGPGGRDRNGYPAVSQSGNGWIRYSDGSYADLNSNAVQKANGMHFGMTTYSGGTQANLDDQWNNIPLSWRADMAQNWAPDAIKNFLEGMASPQGYFMVDGQKMQGIAMAAYVANKMKQAIAQQKQAAGSKPPKTVDSGPRVSAGIGG